MRRAARCEAAGWRPPPSKTGAVAIRPPPVNGVNTAIRPPHPRLYPASDPTPSAVEPSPPPGYDRIAEIVLTRKSALLVQGLSLAMGGAVVVLMLLAAGPRSFTVGPAELGLLFVLLAATLGVVVLHEWVHWLAYSLAGLHPRFGAGTVHGMPVLSTSVARPYGRTTALVGLLAPLVLIDALLLAASAAVPGLFAWTIVPIAMNTGGSAGDLWQAARLARYGPAVLVVDRPDGLVVYGPSGGTGPRGA